VSTIEILVVIFGLFLGYWVVSRFLSGKSRVASGTEVPGPGQDAQRSPADSSPAWHEVLNISPQATVEEIQNAYDVLMHQYHPNMVATLGPELRGLAERKSKQIAIAYRDAMQSRVTAT